MAKIGFLSYWGRPRGQAYVTLCYANMLKDKHEVFILKQGNNPIAPEFDIGVNVTEYPEYIVNEKFFVDWLTENEIDICVFNEYKQWEADTTNNLSALCKKMGVTTLGYLVIEKFVKGQELEYDRIICPTLSLCRFFRQQKIRNFSYVPYSVDMKEFPPKTRTDNESFTFFHPGGFLGVHNRKNTEVVIEAFRTLLEKYKDIKLIITAQKPISGTFPPEIIVINEELSREKLLNLYFKSDATCLPSKWETVGLSILESLATGRPVITVASPPMSEFVKHCITGYLVPYSEIKDYPGISVNGVETDPKDYAKYMELCMKKTTYPIFRRKAKESVIENYTQEKNKKYFLDLVGKIK